MKFGEWLKEQRELKGLTRKELGNFAGIHQSTVSQIEKGTIFRPPNKRLEGFSKALNIPFHRFLEKLGEEKTILEELTSIGG